MPTTRPIPRISLHDFPQRTAQITTELLHAATTTGFFILTAHSLPTTAIRAQFELARAFFALPGSAKALVAFDATRNAGWEANAQIRPSTGQPDRKESYQMQFGAAAMAGKWLPDAHLAGLREQSLAFMRQCQVISEQLMLCFARALDLPDDFFIRAHDVSRPESQTVLRLLRYFALDENAAVPTDHVRAGAHVDWDFITLLFQRPGESGLEMCPGREVSTAFAIGDEWTPVEPQEGEIVCNIGDLLMSWSDDRLKSTFHRVKTPRVKGDWFGDRYSMAYFNQPGTDVVIQGKEKKYEAITGREFTERAMKRNFAALREKQQALKELEESNRKAVAA